MAAGIVHFIYIVPSDKTLNNNYVTALGSLASAVQNFYTVQLNNGKHFNLNNPAIEVFNSTQITSWYDANTVNSSDTNFAFINRTWNDLESISTYRRNDGNHYQIFVDAPTISNWGGATNQVGGAFSTIQAKPTGDSTTSVLFQLSQNQSPISNYIYGVTAHELGHTFGLDHPPNDGSIMAVSQNTTFSNPQFFRASDLTLLRNNSFFQPGTISDNNFAVSDSSVVFELISQNVAGQNQISVNEIIIVADQTLLGKYQVSVSDSIVISDIGVDSTLIIVLISPILTVENPITVTDSIPNHYPDTVTVVDSIGYYPDAVWVKDEVFFSINGAYSVDIENIKVKGVRIIGD